MGSILSVSFSGDNIVSRCWDFIKQQADYVYKLEENLEKLETDLKELTSMKDDLKTRVEDGEKKPFMKRLKQVDNWISSVESIETDVINQVLQHGNQEIEKLCCGSFCSNNYMSSYKFGKLVAKVLVKVADLKSEGVSGEVTERVAAPVVNQVAVEPTVGMELLLAEVWRLIEDDRVGKIGLYGMGGVGKTTLLTQIRNKLAQTRNDFGIVIWIVVSNAKDQNLELIQDNIGENIGLSGDTWKQKKQDEKAQDIFRVLREKKFVLLLDDIWEPTEITKVGVPIPGDANKSKVIFTTRSRDVCGHMDCRNNIEVKCLAWDKAWELFQDKVGKETIFDIHSDIPKLAETVAKECDGLPLALITVGRTMASKTTPQEWNYAIDVLKNSASKFSEKAKNESYHIIGTLLNACLLEVVDEYAIKMHDITREMALWLARPPMKTNKTFLVESGANLSEAPNIEKWKGVERVSLMHNHIKHLVEIPECPNLLTLFLQRNKLKKVAESFFESMRSLQVLDLSKNEELTELPSGVSKLVSLEHLNLSQTGIRELPTELKHLLRLKYLNLEFTEKLEFVPPHIISTFSMLKVLMMRNCGAKDKCPFDSEKAMLDELQCLKHLEVLALNIRSTSCFEQLFSYPNLVTCTRLLILQVLNNMRFLDISSSRVNMKHLEYLRIEKCTDLEELKVNWEARGPNDPRDSMTISRSCFVRLQHVNINDCRKLKDLTWLIFAPNLTGFHVRDCSGMEKIINLEILGGVANVVKELNPFAKLNVLILYDVPKLQSIYESALPFPYLKFVRIRNCPALKKLPLDSRSAQGCNLIIEGEEEWWNGLEWDDKDAPDVFLPTFQPLYKK